MEAFKYGVHVIDNELISSSYQIEEVLKSIFRTIKLNDFHFLMLKKAIEIKVNTIDSLINLCLQHASQIICQNSNELNIRNEILKSILDFQTQRAYNADAYNSKTKQNPQSVDWPNSLKGTSVYNTDVYANKYKLINPSTPVGSAGSCFAMEIACWMQNNGFNYLVTEDNIHPERKTHWSCARWGTIFNAAAFRQLIEHSFGLIELPKYLWRMNSRAGKQIYRDPFREEIEFNTVEEYINDFDKHRSAARKALSSAKVFIITLGLNEVWKFRRDGSVLSRNPWRISPSYVERVILDVNENVSELQKMLNIWRSFNPDLKLIVSVSPVPMARTYQANDMHVIEATALSKATLRVAAHRFCDSNDEVYYFPSFEKIMYGTKDPWECDFRHVKPEAVNGVMQMFQRVFS